MYQHFNPSFTGDAIFYETGATGPLTASNKILFAGPSVTFRSASKDNE